MALDPSMLGRPPMAPPGPGGMPQPPQAPPAGIGGATMPQPNPGNQSAALSKVKVAVQALQEALPSIPLGTPVHEDVMNSIKSLAKHFEKDAESPALSMQALVQMARAAGQHNQMAALSRMQPPSPNTPPAMAQ